MNNFFEQISDSDFTASYDRALQALFQSVVKFEFELLNSGDTHFSILSDYCEIGKVVANMDFAASMAEEYLRREIWKNDDNRIEKDECNFGTYLHLLSTNVLGRSLNKRIYKSYTENREDILPLSAVRVTENLVSMDCGTDLNNSITLGFLEIGKMLKRIVIAGHGDKYNPESVRIGKMDEISQLDVEQSAPDIITTAANKAISFADDLDNIINETPTFCNVFVLCLDLLRWLETGNVYILDYVDDSIEYGDKIDKSFARKTIKSLSEDICSTLDASLAFIEHAYIGMVQNPDLQHLEESPFPVANQSKVMFEMTRPFIVGAKTLLRAIDDTFMDFRMRLSDGFAYTIKELKDKKAHEDR